MNSRIETLLGKFDLKDRVYDGIASHVSEQKWDEVENILDRERTKAKTYIQKALNMS